MPALNAVPWAGSTVAAVPSDLGSNLGTSANRPSTTAPVISWFRGFLLVAIWSGLALGLLLRSGRAETEIEQRFGFAAVSFTGKVAASGDARQIQVTTRNGDSLLCDEPREQQVRCADGTVFHPMERTGRHLGSSR
jgi:hypothetical protein